MVPDWFSRYRADNFAVYTSPEKLLVFHGNCTWSLAQQCKPLTQTHWFAIFQFMDLRSMQRLSRTSRELRSLACQWRNTAIAIPTSSVVRHSVKFSITDDKLFFDNGENNVLVPHVQIIGVGYFTIGTPYSYVSDCAGSLYRIDISRRPVQTKLMNLPRKSRYCILNDKIFGFGNGSGICEWIDGAWVEYQENVSVYCFTVIVYTTDNAALIVNLQQQRVHKFTGTDLTRIHCAGKWPHGNAVYHGWYWADGEDKYELRVRGVVGVWVKNP